MDIRDQEVVVKDFVEKLYLTIEPFLSEEKKEELGLTQNDWGDWVTRFREGGLLQEMDLANWEQPILRKWGARLLHVAMRDVLEIPDIEGLGKAENLRDLYDCRVCVNHIAQVYQRDLMFEREYGAGICLFDGKGCMTRVEADASLEALIQVIAKERGELG